MNFAGFRHSALAAAILFASPSFAQGWHELDDNWLDVIYVPTPHMVVQRMLEIAKAGPEDIHYDLGSGDGRIAIASVKNFNVKRSVGIDLDPQRIKESLENHAKENAGDRVVFLQRNIFETDFSEATVITLYLLNRLNIKLRPIILSMRPGTRVVTQSFTMNEWESDYSEKVSFEENGQRGVRTVFLYIVPAKVQGAWTLSDGRRAILLEIKQDFQRFTGSAVAGNSRTEIRNGRLSGATIEFAIEVDGTLVKYEGRVDDDKIIGTNWTAKRTS